MKQRELDVVQLVRDLTWPTMQAGLPLQTRHGPALAQFEPECCVSASRIAMEILAEHYIHAVAMKTFVAVYTHQAWEWQVGGQQGPLPDPEHNAVRVCGLQPARKGWLNGHVVLIVEKELLLDVSCQQFALPNQGLPSVEPVAIDLTNTVWPGDPTQPLAVTIEHGTMVYQQHPDLSGLYDAPAWKARDIDRIMFREHILGLVNEHLAATV